MVEVCLPTVTGVLDNHVAHDLVHTEHKLDALHGEGVFAAVAGYRRSVTLDVVARSGPPRHGREEAVGRRGERLDPLEIYRAVVRIVVLDLGDALEVEDVSGVGVSSVSRCISVRIRSE